ncbi:hypothetical protein [Spirosoma luteolum]
MKAILPLLLLGLAGCSDPNLSASTGPADPRLTGTWRLYERRFVKDSVYSVRIDTITQTRDTSFVTTRRYRESPAQTLTFDASGSLKASGSEMTYYYPMHSFRLDTTYPDSLFVNFYITSNRATTFSRQRTLFRGDTLQFRPDPDSYSKFLKVR